MKPFSFDEREVFEPEGEYQNHREPQPTREI
jgi:hypothetical protein